MFDRFGNYYAALFAAVTMALLAFVLTLSTAQERGRWLAHGCETDTDCARMAAYLCRNGNAAWCEAQP